MSSRYPLAGYAINNHVTRLHAVFMVVLASTGLAVQDTARIVLAAVITVDHLALALSRPGLSLGHLLGDRILSALGLRANKVDAGPSRFASRLTVLISLGILILSARHETVPALIVTGVLMVLALLEAAAGWCLACRLYQGIMNTFGKDPDPDQF